jgi:DNA polymerase I-like protein with 3'-5' exonuclease and polymerase domains
MKRDGWKPDKLTATGKPVIDEVVLKDIGTKEALIFHEILVLQKKLGMLSQGSNAWLKLVKNGRLHHSCFIGAATHRMAHSKPNLAQVSSDQDCRELFVTKSGWKLVDSDLAGIELRMFAHYLARYDEGRYAQILLNGDIHQVNADKIGISRKLVKTVTYAFLYGAGDRKIGTSYDSQLSADKATEKGKEIRKAYMDAIPGLNELVKAAKEVSKSGKIRAIDGRYICVDKGHKALNFLLQSSAGVIAKRWILITHEWLQALDVKHERYAFVHDEQVIGAPPSSAEDVARLCKCSALEAGETYKLRLPIEADANIGDNWAEVH